MKKLLTMMMVLGLTVGVLAGCGAKEDPVTEPDTPVTEDTTDAEDVEDTGEENIKVGILLKTLSNPFWVDMAEGIKAEAESQGIEVDIHAVQSEEEVEGQLEKMEDMVNSGEYDGIGIAPITATNLINGVVAANAKDIPVVNIDAQIDGDALAEAGGYVIGFATSDNFKVGQIGAESLIETIGADGGEIAIIEGRAGDLSGELRRDGAIDIIEKTDNFKVGEVQPADWDRQKALDVATNVITKNPDIKGFFVANDTMSLGVLQAIVNTGNLGKMYLVGTDASDETIEAIKAGNMNAVVQSPGRIGATCFNILVDAIKAGETGSPDYEAVSELVDADLLTKENVED